MYFLGIDVGTTHVKTCLLDQDLHLVRVSLDTHELHDLPGIGLCYEPNYLWDLLLCQIESLLSGIDPAKLRGIGVTSMAEAGLPVDRDGCALYPIVPWNDIRSKTYGQTLLDRFGAYELYRRTGIIYHPKYSVTRMMQIRAELPGIFQQMYRWLSVTDFVMNRLCGSFVMDESQACRTLLYDIRNHRWDPELVEAAGMTGKLPDVIPMGATAGILKFELASRFGLRRDVAIVSGGQDHLCAAIAVGDGAPGTVINSMGTSEVYFGLSDQPRLDEAAFAACLNQGCFADGRYYWIANIPGSGASIEWLRQILSVNGDLGYALFSDKDRLRDPSSLFYFPYVNGSGSPHTDHERRGLFYGLTASTDVHALIKAVFEGIAFEARWIQEALAGLDIPVSRILSVGGGTKNEAFVQTKASVLGRTLTVTGLKEATGIGAAMQAARAAGLVTDFSGQRDRTAALERDIQPDPEHHRHYQVRFDQYRQLFDVITSFEKGNQPT